MSGWRGVQDNRSIGTAPQKIADRAECGDFVDTGGRKSDQLLHRFTIELNLPIRSAGKRAKDLVNPFPVATPELIEFRHSIDLDCVQIRPASDGRFEVANRLAKTIGKRMGGIARKNQKPLVRMFVGELKRQSRRGRGLSNSALASDNHDPLRLNNLPTVAAVYDRRFFLAKCDRPAVIDRR